MEDPTEAERSRDVGIAVAHATRMAIDAPAAAVDAKFDQCLETVLPMAGSPDEVLEVRRRVAEARVSVLWEAGDADRFMDAWREVERLGYLDVEREASMVWYFLAFSARNGEDERSCMAALTRLGDLTATMPELMREHFVQARERVRAELVQASRSRPDGRHAGDR